MVESFWQQVTSPKKTFIIAEAGVNHNGELSIAKDLVNCAVLAGADAVKFQTYKTKNVVTRKAPKAAYQQKNGGSESQYEMLRRLELSENDHIDLFNYCAEKAITFLSTPFDEESADFLDNLGVKAFKIPSGEIINTPFLSHVAKKRKPIILSTGMTTLGEVESAVNAIAKAGNESLVLLHCVSNYPSDYSDVNLLAIKTLSRAFGVPVGYSDHTLGIEISIAAASMGACIVEKHFTLDRELPGPDHKASLNPDELSAMVKAIRNVNIALGNGIKKPSPNESDTADIARKSLVAAMDIPRGTVLASDMLIMKRPGTGLSPVFKDYIIGKCAKVDIPSDTLLNMDMVT